MNNYREYICVPVGDGRFKQRGIRIVRCEDCKFFQNDHDVCTQWESFHHLVEKDGFCKWGERISE